jgi:hypothetical protein
MAKIDAFFNLMFEQKASDLHLSSGNNPMLRINGELQRVDHPPLENDELKKMLYEIAPDYKIKVFEETGDVDFGYEIPTPDVAGPHDPARGGERLFERFLEVICGEIRRADPRVAILYYCLTPLFRRYIDQCGMDDLWMSRGAYDDGHARRALLSSWCGAFGVVPYGSSGYDWQDPDQDLKAEDPTIVKVAAREPVTATPIGNATHDQRHARS